MSEPNAYALSCVAAREFYYGTVMHGDRPNFTNFVVLSRGTKRAHGEKKYAVEKGEELAQELGGRIVGVYGRGRYVREARQVICGGGRVFA